MQGIKVHTLSSKHIHQYINQTEFLISFLIYIFIPQLSHTVYLSFSTSFVLNNYCLCKNGATCWLLLENNALDKNALCLRKTFKVMEFRGFSARFIHPSMGQRKNVDHFRTVCSTGKVQEMVPKTFDLVLPQEMHSANSDTTPQCIWSGNLNNNLQTCIKWFSVSTSFFRASCSPCRDRKFKASQWVSGEGGDVRICYQRARTRLPDWGEVLGERLPDGLWLSASGPCARLFVLAGDLYFSAFSGQFRPVVCSPRWLSEGQSLPGQCQSPFCNCLVECYSGKVAIATRQWVGVVCTVTRVQKIRIPLTVTII